MIGNIWKCTKYTKIRLIFSKEKRTGKFFLAAHQNLFHIFVTITNRILMCTTKRISFSLLVSFIFTNRLLRISFFRHFSFIHGNSYSWPHHKKRSVFLCMHKDHFFNIKSSTSIHVICVKQNIFRCA